MAFRVVPCLCTILLLICLLLSQPKSYRCYTSHVSINRVSGDLFLTDTSTRTKWDKVPSSGLGSYMKSYYPAFNLSDNGWFTFDNYIPRLDEASFNISVVVSVYQPNKNLLHSRSSSLVFAIQPQISHPGSYGPVGRFMYYIPPYDPLSPPSTTPIIVAGSHIFAQISTAYGKTISGFYYPRISGVASGISGYDSFTNIVLVQIDIEPLDNYSSLQASKEEYTMWIDYNQDGHRMSVYVGEGTLKPANAMAHATLNIQDMTPSVSFALFSSIGQLLQIHRVNSSWAMALNPSAETPPPESPRRSDSHGKRTAIDIFYSLLALVAASMPAAAVYFYLKSKYRMWKKEQDKLSKAMQRLPGVPIQVDYADIRKATNNFDARMKLGQGGFGAVYQCTLPAAATMTERPMKVAIKKFTQQVEHQRYNDFLNEVSIINRLRHKNIVPLVGWSYNRGVPLLIFEYMTNGSLDQHLFRRGSISQQNQQEDNCTRQWHVRYGIARDIATGLNYVHHEHEPVVLHRDIKASNIMLDSNFNARLGDFGIACTVSVNRRSVAGIVGTFGYIAPDYAMSHEATPKTDIYAFGVLMLEIVAGKKNGDVGPDDIHITDWVWRLRQEGMLLEAVDSVLSAGDPDQQDDSIDEAKRLLLIGLACTNPNPWDRPTMVEVLQVLTKVAPLPDVPLERPTFVWPPEDWRSRNSVYSTAASNCDSSSANTIELGQVSLEQPSSGIAGGHVSVYSRETSRTAQQGCPDSGVDTTE